MYVMGPALQLSLLNPLLISHSFSEVTQEEAAQVLVHRTSEALDEVSDDGDEEKLGWEK